MCKSRSTTSPSTGHDGIRYQSNERIGLYYHRSEMRKSRFDILQALLTNQQNFIYAPSFPFLTKDYPTTRLQILCICQF